MQRVPAAAILDIGTQRLLLIEPWDDVAGIGDEEVGLLDRGNVRVVLEYPDTNTLVFRQQLEELKPGEIDVVILAARDERDLDLPLPLG